MWSWSELCVWEHVSFGIISVTADVKVVWKSFTVLCNSLTPTVKIPLDRVQDAWSKSSGPFQIKRLADHYGVFTDLFHMAYFLPQVPLHICYSQENTANVNYGNRLTPTQVWIRSRNLIFLTLIFTNMQSIHLYLLYLGSFCSPGHLRSRGGFPLDSTAHQSRLAFPQCTASTANKTSIFINSILTSLSFSDEHLLDNEAEYIHWLVWVHLIDR